MSAGSPFVGLISDTHGLVRPEALDALRGAVSIVHAGDVGRPQVLDSLREIAPVHAVRGNVDRDGWAEALPWTEQVEVGDRLIHVLHTLDELDLDPAAAGFDVVVHGHSHRPSIEKKAGVWYVNPGSAGPRRFRLPIAVARLAITESELTPRIVELAVC